MSGDEFPDASSKMAVPGAGVKKIPAKTMATNAAATKAPAKKAPAKKAPAKKAAAKKAAAKESGATKNPAATVPVPAVSEVAQAPMPEVVSPDRRRSRISRLLSTAGMSPTHSFAFLTLTGLLVVAALVLVFVNVRADQVDEMRSTAPKLVVAHVQKLLSYTPSTVASDLATEEKWLTGDFADRYVSLVKDTVAPAAQKGGVTTDASIVARGVVSSSKNRLVLLVFVNLATSKDGADGVETQGSRIQVTANKVNGSWLISGLTPM